jgi:hypothetical protein
MSLVEEKDDGGPAFPCDSTLKQHPTQEGMSLRDDFAGQALAGLLSIFEYDEEVGESTIADMAYNQADAMLEVRKNG